MTHIAVALHAIGQGCKQKAVVVGLISGDGGEQRGVSRRVHARLFVTIPSTLAVATQNIGQSMAEQWVRVKMWM